MKSQIFTKILVASLVALWFLWLNNVNADELDEVVDYLIASQEQELGLAAGQGPKGDANCAKTAAAKAAGKQQSTQAQETAEVVLLSGAVKSTNNSGIPAKNLPQKDKQAPSR
jgi:hypothetical protein